MNSNGKSVVKQPNSEESIANTLLSLFLIWSVVVSVSIIAFGVVEFLVTGSTGYIRLPVPILLKTGGLSTVAFPHTLPSIVLGVLTLKSFAVIQIGLLILLLTPLGRMFLQILIYVKERDRYFILIASTVLAILMFSLYLSRFII